MGWELIVAAAILGPSLIIAVKTWGRDRSEVRKFQEREAQRANECPHVWQQWEITNVRRLRLGDDYIGQTVYQARVCDMCGLTESKKEEVA